ncbi:maleylpyruvate isomerase family mycothiol-dependent enzyme [Monashia sp. NPDC004114]
MQPADVTPALVAAETERVVATAASFDDLAVSAPSICEGWSRGHVLTHIARNADALARVCAVATDGVSGSMYDSNESRDTEIEAGAGRPAADQTADVRESAARLAGRLESLQPEHAELTVPRTPGGERLIAVGGVPYLRLRELVYHHVDLDAGYTFADAPADVVAMLLADAVARLGNEDEPPAITVTTDEGGHFVIGAGTTQVAGPQAAVLTWIARSRTDGVTFDGPVPVLPFGG